MSEFECRCGGLIIAGKCTDCEHPTLWLMDGKSKGELDAERCREEDLAEEL